MNTLFSLCECPGRSLVPDIGMAIKLFELKPDEVRLSSCLVNAKPGCPCSNAEEMVQIITNKTEIKVKQGAHEYN